MFSELPAHMRELAGRILAGLLKRHQGDLPQWRRAILVGQAKSLALNPRDSAWGRSMHAKRGGYAVQRKYWLEGRHPTEKATHVRLLRQKARKTQQAQVLARGTASPRITAPETAVKANRVINLPNLRPPPSIEARMLHKQLDPPGCRCYYCAWPNLVE